MHCSHYGGEILCWQQIGGTTASTRKNHADQDTSPQHHPTEGPLLTSLCFSFPWDFALHTLVISSDPNQFQWLSGVGVSWLCHCGDMHTPGTRGAGNCLPSSPPAPSMGYISPWRARRPGQKSTPQQACPSPKGQQPWPEQAEDPILRLYTGETQPCPSLQRC